MHKIQMVDILIESLYYLLILHVLFSLYQTCMFYDQVCMMYQVDILSLCAWYSIYELLF